jgi:polyisoprenoid-binding protein YceI
MKKLTFVFIALFILVAVQAQERYFTKNGLIDFFSSTPMEDIKADNDKVAAFLNTETGDLQFAVLMKSFEFKKALMQEHFNENYVESDKFPKASFKGKILDYSKSWLSEQGKKNVKVAGVLTIHGVSKDVAADGTLDIASGQVQAISKFIVKPEDYDITIPNAVRNNIATEIEVNVDVTLKP